MPPALIVRDGAPRDASVLASIHVNARATAMPWLAVVHTPADTVRWMADVVLATQRVRVATWDQGVIGFSASTDGWLEQLYVSPAFQNQGVGSRLFADAVAAARTPFQFWVFQRNVGARRFYERYGCLPVRTTEGRENEEREPDVLYEKALPR